MKDCATRWDMVEALRKDIRDFKAANNCDRIVVIWLLQRKSTSQLTKTFTAHSLPSKLP